jgi:hypothetical protein
VTNRSTLQAVLAMLLMWLLAPAAMAQTVDLHDGLCIRGRADAIAQVGSGAYRIAPCADPSAPRAGRC